MKLAVVGSRGFKDKERLFSILSKNRENIKLIVSGNASGPDTFAVEWAQKYGVPYLVFPPLWHNPDTGVFDKGAGFKRNGKIIDACDEVLAFWDGESKGTSNSIEWAKKKNKPIQIISFENPENKFYKFGSTSHCFHPAHKLDVFDKSKNVTFESVKDGFFWYFFMYKKKFEEANNVIKTNLHSGFQFTDLKFDAEDKEIVVKIMKYLNKLKFIQYEDLKKQLLETRDKIIVFDDDSNKFWQESLSKILMDIRDELRSKL